MRGGVMRGGGRGMVRSLHRNSFWFFFCCCSGHAGSSEGLSILLSHQTPPPPPLPSAHLSNLEKSRACQGEGSGWVEGNSIQSRRTLYPGLDK